MRKEAKVFWRIFKFIWPQWMRLVGVVGAALLIAILFGLSFMTVLPLLKVMMSEEGLHGWVDRKSSNLRYGFDFYVPDRSDLLGQQDMIYYLRVTRIDEDSVAARSGVRLEDRIVQVGPPDDSGRMASPVMLERLALAADGAVIPMTIQRPSTDGGYRRYRWTWRVCPGPTRFRRIKCNGPSGSSGWAGGMWFDPRNGLSATCREMSHWATRPVPSNSSSWR
jgi:hypothetical protein